MSQPSGCECDELGSSWASMGEKAARYMVQQQRLDPMMTGYVSNARVTTEVGR